MKTINHSPAPSRRTRWARAGLGLAAGLAVCGVIVAPHMVQGQSAESGGGLSGGITDGDTTPAGVIDITDNLVRIPPDLAAPSDARKTIDPVLRSRVSRVRKAVGLTRDDLAAMDMDQQQAEQVLNGLVSWAQSNAGALQKNENDLRQAYAERQAILKDINTGAAGTRWERVYEQADQQVTDAESDRVNLQADALARVQPLLRSEQAQLRSRAQANRQIKGVHRYADFEGLNRGRSQGEARGGRVPEVAQGPELRGQSADQRRAAVLDAQTKQALSQIADRMDQRLEGVAAAEQAVFTVSTEEFERPTRAGTP